MKQRIFLRDLEKFDLKHETSIVREIEMTVDSMIKDQTYSIQFWRDVQLYGVDEAILYLKNNNQSTPEQLIELEQTWNRIKQMINNPDYVSPDLEPS